MNTRQTIEKEIIEKLRKESEKNNIKSFPSRSEQDFVKSLNEKQLFAYRNLTMDALGERNFRDEYVVRFVLDQVAKMFVHGKIYLTFD